MSIKPLGILGTGLVTSVGLDAPSSCAAIRAKLSNPTETSFIGTDGNWIFGHRVQLPYLAQGFAKLTRMAVISMHEALRDLPRTQWAGIPVLLCVGEKERPGRLAGLDETLFASIQQDVGEPFPASSGILPHGRASIAVALAHARVLVYERKAPAVLIVATDSLLSWPTLDHYDRAGRLLTPSNSNGFMPGEAAGALLVGRPSTRTQLVCTGIGFGNEPAHIESAQPLRADGLVSAIRAALIDAGRTMHEIDLRITDLSGEQFYFKEATLAVARILRKVKEEFDLWHPAESIGETGAAAGVAVIALAHNAILKRYANATALLVHMSNDSGLRGAVTLQAGATS